MLAQAYEVFDVQSATNGVTAIAGLATLVVVLRFAMTVLIAYYVFHAAGRLASDGTGPALFPPFVWGLAALLMGSVSVVLLVALFCALHYTDLFRFDRGPWTRLPDAVTPLGTDHANKVAALQQEIRELRRQNRENESS
ncbi:MAG: hypothetical protein AAGG01_10240 [Planctomycetota bacterium]